ncbi:MAG: P-type conjugative transfer protein VirB9 [Rickettsiales bacterium]
MNYANMIRSRLPVLLSALLFGLLCIGAPKNVSALEKPRPLATDSRIQTILYSPNDVFSFLGHYGYQSIIEFAEDEEIQTVSLGDSVAWQLQPVGFRLFIKPVEQDAETNMSVITNKHTYHFELHAAETENIRDKKMLFVLRFIYPESEQLSSLGGNGTAIPDLTDPQVRKDLNFKYSIVGNDSISPIRIFDDGEFTYFQFRDKNAELPAFYVVDPGGNEAMLNFKTVDDYIVVERVSPRFTLRSSGEIVCVFNDNMKMGPVPIPEKDGNFFTRLLDW